MSVTSLGTSQGAVGRHKALDHGRNQFRGLCWRRAAVPCQNFRVVRPLTGLFHACDVWLLRRSPDIHTMTRLAEALKEVLS